MWRYSKRVPEVCLPPRRGSSAVEQKTCLCPFRKSRPTAQSAYRLPVVSRRVERHPRISGNPSNRLLQGGRSTRRAIVTVEDTRSGRVTVTGDVGSPSRVPLAPEGERLLDVIANAGGTSGNPAEIFVQLSRGGQNRRVSVAFDHGEPKERISMSGPVTQFSSIASRRCSRHLVQLGRAEIFPFEYERMTLAEAVGAASGLNDSRADPAGVFLYRLERGEVVCELMAYETCKSPDGKHPRDLSAGFAQA